MVSPQYELSYAYQNTLLWKSFLTMGALIWSLPSMNSHMHAKITIYFLKKLSYNGCIDMVSPQYEFLYASQDYSKMKKLSHTGCIDMGFPQCESAYDYQEQSSMKKIF